jgi:hypothetical protein
MQLHTVIYIRVSITLSEKCISDTGPKYLCDEKYLENERGKGEEGKRKEWGSEGREERERVGAC